MGLATTAKGALGAGISAARPLLDVLGRPGVSGPLAIAGGLAIAASALRIGLGGRFDRDAGIAFLIGVACLALSALPRVALGTGLPLSRHLFRLGPRVRLATGLAGLAGLLLAGAATFLPGRLSLPSLAGLPANPFAATIVEGRASVLGPDVLRIGATVIRLAGIEAPEREQRCKGPRNKAWRCGEAAEAALGRLARGKALRCEVRGTDEAGRARGVCFDKQADINALLVKGGHVFAEARLLSSYGRLEAEAQAARAGLWIGEAERPAAYRAKLWEEARRRAPEGCPIKGRVAGGAKVYVLPWSAEYHVVGVSKARGERWFCSEQEAISAGWKSAQRG